MSQVRERQRAETLDRIREAATTLFAESDYRRVTMQAIAKAAGVGEATLFRHVSEKLDLLTLVYGSLFDDLLNDIEQQDARAALAPQQDGRQRCDRILAVYQARCAFYQRHPVNGAAYLAQGFNVLNPAHHRNIAQGDRTIRLVTTILEDGQRGGVILGTVVARDVAQNCHGIYMHEIQRTAVREFTPESSWERVHARLRAQLDPLIIEANA